jgi:hypothetical protein
MQVRLNLSIQTTTIAFILTKYFHYCFLPEKNASNMIIFSNPVQVVYGLVDFSALALQDL